MAQRTLLVGYDLNTPGQDYDELIEKLKTYGKSWHYLDSTWLIQTDKTHKEVRDELGQLKDANDEILVVDVTGDDMAWAGLSDKAAQWIRDNV